MNRFSLGLAATLALSGCGPAKEELDPLRQVGSSNATFAVQLLKNEGEGAKARNELWDAAKFQTAKEVPSFPVPQVQMADAIYSVIQMTTAKKMCLILSKGGGNGTAKNLRIDGDPATPVETTCM